MTTHTHKSLCELAVRWLKRPRSSGGPGCIVAIREAPTGHNGEIPDAIGFRVGWQDDTSGSVMIEVKVSRGDFLADARKPHRDRPGVGVWRYYMAPEGLIDVSELPPRWGLLEVNSKGHVKPKAGHAMHCRGSDPEYVRQATLWRHLDVDMLREQFLIVRVLANTGDPQKTLDMLREKSNINARLTSRISKIGVALGLPKGETAYQVERAAHQAARARDLYLESAKDVRPVPRRIKSS